MSSAWRIKSGFQRPAAVLFACDCPAAHTRRRVRVLRSHGPCDGRFGAATAILIPPRPFRVLPLAVAPTPRRLSSLQIVRHRTREPFRRFFRGPAFVPVAPHAGGSVEAYPRSAVSAIPFFTPESEGRLLALSQHVGPGIGRAIDAEGLLVRRTGAHHETPTTWRRSLIP